MMVFGPRVGTGMASWGDGSTQSRTAYVQVFSSGAKAVAAGSRHSMVLQEDGSVWAAGRNYHGQLGDGSKSYRANFVRVIVSGAKTVAAGGYHSMLLKQDGSVGHGFEPAWSVRPWGDNP